MYFIPFTVRVGAEQKGFESGAARPVIAMRLTSDGETELLLATDGGGLSWVDRDFVQVVDTGAAGSAAGAQPPARAGSEEPQKPREGRSVKRRP